MKVLVVGANGRLGRACVQSLSRKGHEVVALVRVTSTFPEELQAKCATVIEGDARQLPVVEAAIRENGCDGVINAGGYTPFFPGQKTDHPLIFCAVLDAAESIARERSGGETILPERRIRVWILSELGMMDCPWPDNRLLWQ
jgi:nucleoside-diphosphate-sugar epimerase